MDYTPLPTQAPKLEIKSTVEDKSLNNAPVLKTTEKKMLTVGNLDIMINRISSLPANDEAKLTKVKELLKGYDGNFDGISDLNKADLLKMLIETKQQLHGSVLPFTTDLSSQAEQFKLDSKHISSQLIVNDYRHGGGVQTQNFNTIRSAKHVLNTTPESIVRFDSKKENRRSIDPSITEMVEVQLNDSRFTDNNNNIIAMKGATSKISDFALAGNSLESIRMEAASKLSNPNLVTDEEFLRIIKNEGVQTATVYNSRNFITGENLFRAEKVEVTVLPLYANQLDYSGVNLSKEQKKVFSEKGGIIYISKSDDNMLGTGSSGSILNITTNDGKNLEGNHSAGFRVNAEQAKAIEQNNPEFSNQIKEFFLKNIGENLSLEESINRGLINNEREIGKQNIGKYVISIGVVETKERYKEILEVTNPVPKTIFQQLK